MLKTADRNHRVLSGVAAGFSRRGSSFLAFVILDQGAAGALTQILFLSCLLHLIAVAPNERKEFTLLLLLAATVAYKANVKCDSDCDFFDQRRDEAAPLVTEVFKQEQQMSLKTPETTVRFYASCLSKYKVAKKSPHQLKTWMNWRGDFVILLSNKEGISLRKTRRSQKRDAQPLHCQMNKKWNSLITTCENKTNKHCIFSPKTRLHLCVERQCRGLSRDNSQRFKR